MSRQKNVNAALKRPRKIRVSTQLRLSPLATLEQQQPERFRHKKEILYARIHATEGYQRLIKMLGQITGMEPSYDALVLLPRFKDDVYAASTLRSMKCALVWWLDAQGTPLLDEQIAELDKLVKGRINLTVLDKQQTGVLEPAQFAQFKSWMDKRYNNDSADARMREARDAIVLACAGGLRFGEVSHVAMRFAGVDAHLDRIFVDTNGDWNVTVRAKVADSKGVQPLQLRTVMPTFRRDFVDMMKRRLDPEDPFAPMFSSTASLTRRARMIIDEANAHFGWNIANPKLRFATHFLRNSFALATFEETKNLPKVSKALGHGQSGSTTRQYTRTVQQRLDDAAEHQLGVDKAHKLSNDVAAAAARDLPRESGIIRSRTEFPSAFAQQHFAPALGSTHGNHASPCQQATFYVITAEDLKGSSYRWC